MKLGVTQKSRIRFSSPNNARGRGDNKSDQGKLNAVLSIDTA